jgi:WD40 repeat protein
LWDLEAGGPSRTLASVPGIAVPQLAVDPRGRFVAVSTGGGVALVPLAGGPMRRLEGYSPETWIGDVAVDAGGRRVAACSSRGPAEDKVIRIWDLETEEMTVLGPIEGAGDDWDGLTWGLGFLPDGSLVSNGEGGLRVWNVRENSNEIVAHGDGSTLAVFGGGRYVANISTSDETSYFPQITDLETRTTRVLPSQIKGISCIATDPKGAVLVSAAFQDDSAVQVGPISGGEPHLLLGHERGVRDVAVSPDGRWIASDGHHEGSVRLWPMPDLSKPPLHTLPREELIAKLKTLTNLRVVRDEESSTGWKVEVGPFPGWENVPTW